MTELKNYGICHNRDCCPRLHAWKAEGKSKGFWYHYKQEVIDEYLEGNKEGSSKDKMPSTDRMYPADKAA